MHHALVTGCSRGLGYHLLHTYLEDGWTVFPVVRNTAPISHLSKRHAGRCFPIHSDITSQDLEKSLRSVLLANDAKLSVVINNAGTGGRHEPSISKVDARFLASMVSTHCIGAISVVKAALPFIQKASSNVVNVSSRLGSAQRNGNKEFSGLGFSYSYRIAKASQNMATLCMSQDSELSGVIVCSIHPGRLKTDSGAFDADTEPVIAAQRMKSRIEAMTIEDNGTHIDLENGVIPW